MPKVSLCLACWNTAHLLGRTLHTLTQQTVQDFEVILINDNSEDDVASVVDSYKHDLDIKLHTLKHNFGMRGNTTSFNTAFGLAQGDILLENTPEIMFYPNTISDLVDKLENLGKLGWVSIRTYNLVAPDQKLIDTVDWMNDVRLLETLPNFQEPWTQHNRKNAFYGTHQTCAIYRDSWFKYMRRFPFFLDYGTDDPWYAGAREKYGFESVTIPQMVYHQWHAPIAFWMAQGKAPNWNKWGHTMRNHYNDAGVPDKGTSELWDTDYPEGQFARMTEEDKLNWLGLLDDVQATGFVGILGEV